VDGGGSPSTREVILQAADRVVVEEGVAGMTLEAVARGAGVSKGGLLYHFPSKEALIRGMIGRLIEGFRDALGREFAEERTSTSGRWLRAYIRASFDEDRWYLEVSAGLLAAVAEDPTLLDPLRKAFEDGQRWAERDGLDPADATLVRLAADGLFFAELLGFAPPEGQLRERVREALLLLTKGARK
jgi:AcrR family transcriptional regulator